MSGNFFTLAFGRQVAKGTAQTVPTVKLKVTGGTIEPQRTEIELQETDSSRQQSKTIVTAASIAGSPDIYIRPDDFGLLAYGLLGTNADSGTSPNFIHTASLLNSGALPYFTIYKAIGSTVLVDRYVDCRLSGAKIRGQAGQALTGSFDIMGLTADFGQTDPVLSVVTQDPIVYPQVTVQKAGVVPATVEQFEIDLTNNIDVIQADTKLTPYDVSAGKLQVSGTFTLLFENDQDYRKFHAGGASGSSLSTSLFTERLEINCSVNSNLGIDFVFQNVAYTAYPVNPDASGKPIRVAVGWRAMPDAATLANYIQVTTKNGISTY